MAGAGVSDEDYGGSDGDGSKKRKSEKKESKAKKPRVEVDNMDKKVKRELAAVKRELATTNRGFKKLKVDDLMCLLHLGCELEREQPHRVIQRTTVRDRHGRYFSAVLFCCLKKVLLFEKWKKISSVSPGLLLW